jgi:hypothetical protein
MKSNRTHLSIRISLAAFLFFIIIIPSIIVQAQLQISASSEAKTFLSKGIALGKQGNYVRLLSFRQSYRDVES